MSWRTETNGTLRLIRDASGHRSVTRGRLDSFVRRVADIVKSKIARMPSPSSLEMAFGAVAETDDTLRRLGEGPPAPTG